MRLATIDNGTQDGELVIVSRSGESVAPVEDGRFRSLIQAIESWDESFPVLTELSRKVEAGEVETLKAAEVSFRSPLPRTWAFLDGSAFLSHVVLVRKARGAEPPEDMKTVPLMYQGISDSFLSPAEPVPLLDPSFGLDFEGEFAVVLDETPIGISPAEALSRIRLILLLNDWTLRNLIPRELQAGFGFLQSKPASSFAPYALTPDELGDFWRDGRVHLPLECRINNQLVGTPHGNEMYFSFGDLIAHAARTRRLSAGTILGSGTVSNEDAGRGVSCLAEKRMREKIETGQMITPFLKEGDSVDLRVSLNGQSIFGPFSQSVTRVNARQV